MLNKQSPTDVASLLSSWELEWPGDVCVCLVLKIEIHYIIRKLLLNERFGLKIKRREKEEIKKIQVEW